MLLLVGHVALDATACFRRRKAETPGAAASDAWVQRFNDQVRAQHLLLMASVTALCLSGVFLFGTRFSSAPWAAALTGALGGLDVWRVVHRLPGLLLAATAAWHLVYSIVNEEGRRDFRLLLPTPADFRHLWQNLRHLLGRTDRRPEFGRFTYFEKFDFWGCAVMIGTGLALWFGDGILRLWPRFRNSTLDAFKEAHAHEAVLAFLAGAAEARADGRPQLVLARRLRARHRTRPRRSLAHAPGHVELVKRRRRAHLVRSATGGEVLPANS